MVAYTISATHALLAAARHACEARRVRKAAQAADCRARQRAANLGMTPHAARVAMAVYVIAKHDASIAAQFISKRLEQPTEHDLAEFAVWVENKYLEWHL